MKILTALGLSAALLFACSGGSPEASSKSDSLMDMPQLVDTETSTQAPATYTSDAICRAQLRAVYEDSKMEGDFKNCNFVWANFMLADHSNDDFSGANFRGANLSWVNFASANLSGADLREASLRGSNLRGADLTGANLTNANLSDAIVRNRQLAFTILCQTILPDGLIADRDC
jgi:hypothetical protein